MIYTEDSARSYKLFPNFTLFEFLYSALGWSYPDIKYLQLTIDDNVLSNIKKVASVLQDVRNSLQTPIYLNSGYRSRQLNDKLREFNYQSHPRSYHMIGLAADIRGANQAETYRIWNLLHKHKSVDIAHSYCKKTSKSCYIHFQLYK